jgi:hypothetical protein
VLAPLWRLSAALSALYRTPRTGSCYSPGLTTFSTPPTTFSTAATAHVRPFRISATAPEDGVDIAAVREKAISLVAEKPDHYSKTSLAGSLKIRNEDAVSLVRSLLEDGTLGPDKARAKLRLQEPTLAAAPTDR